MSTQFPPASYGVPPVETLPRESNTLLWDIRAISGESLGKVKISISIEINKELPNLITQITIKIPERDNLGVYTIDRTIAFGIFLRILGTYDVALGSGTRISLDISEMVEEKVYIAEKLSGTEIQVIS